MNVEKTRQLLQPLISRPLLTDQLLERPPFRFLLDIVIEVTNSTGFLKDVFNAEELDVKMMLNKDAKIFFLRKLIQVLNTDGSLDNVKAGKILAGKEAEMTNLLLQKLGNDASQFLLLSNEQSNENVEKRRKEHKKETSNRHSEAKGKKHRKLTDNNDERQKKRSENKESKEATKEKRRGDERRSSTKDTSGRLAEEHKEKKHHSRDKSRPKKEKEESTERGKTEIVKTKTKHHRSDLPTKENIRKNDYAGDGAVTEDGLPEKNDAMDSNFRVQLNSDNNFTEDHTVDGVKTESEKIVNTNNEHEIPLPLPPAPKQQKTVQISIPFPTHPQISLERPGTAVARTAPPKLKKRQIAETGVKTENVKEEAPVIVNERSDTDEFNFIVDDVDVATEQPHSENDIAELEMKEHGVLVKKILETKKELEVGLESYFSPSVYDENQRNQIKTEMEDMQKTVQRLTQALHPLARLFDYVQEDVDNMVHEMNEWRLEKQNRDSEANMTNVKINLETEKLLITLKKLDEEIKEKRIAIARVRANIIENDKNIAKLLNNM